MTEDNFYFEEEEKSPKRKWYIIGAIVLVIIVIIGIFLSSGSNTSVPTSRFECIAKNVTYDCSEMSEPLKLEVTNGAYHPFCKCTLKEVLGK